MSSLSWTTILIIWTLANCSPMWLTIYTNKNSRPNPIRDANFKPFVRNDYDNWSYSIALFTHFFFLPRFIIGWCIFCIGNITAFIFCIGDDPFNLAQWKVDIIKKVCYFSAMFGCLAGGIWPRR